MAEAPKFEQAWLELGAAERQVFKDGAARAGRDVELMDVLGVSGDPSEMTLRAFLLNQEVGHNSKNELRHLLVPRDFEYQGRTVTAYILPVYIVGIRLVKMLADSGYTYGIGFTMDADSEEKTYREIRDHVLDMVNDRLILSGRAPLPDLLSADLPTTESPRNEPASEVDKFLNTLDLNI